MSMIQYSERFKPTEMIESQYGYISAREYLQKERIRIGSDPSRLAEVRKSSKTGKIALFVNLPNNLEEE